MTIFHISGNQGSGKTTFGNNLKPNKCENFTLVMLLLSF